MIIANYGEWYIDSAALSQLSADADGIIDNETWSEMVQEHTHVSINNRPASEEELRRMFGLNEYGLGGGTFQLHAADEDNINDIIFGWQPDIFRRH